MILQLVPHFDASSSTSSRTSSCSRSTSTTRIRLSLYSRYSVFSLSHVFTCDLPLLPLPLSFSLSPLGRIAIRAVRWFFFFLVQLLQPQFVSLFLLLWRQQMKESKQQPPSTVNSNIGSSRRPSSFSFTTSCTCTYTFASLRPEL